MYDPCSAADRPTSGDAHYHHTTKEGRRTLPLNSGGHCSLCSHDPFHSQGECEDQEEPHSQEGSSQIIPEWARNLEREVTPEPTQQDADNCTVNIVIVPGALNYNSARGTEHYKYQGHIGQLWQPETVFGSGQVRWFLYFLPQSPLHIRAGAYLPIFNSCHLRLPH